MTTFDYAFLVLLGLSVLLGLWRGLVSEIFSLVSWLLAGAIAKWFAADLVVVFATWVETPALRWPAAFASIFISVLLVLSGLRWLIRELLAAVGLGLVDRLLGAGFGVLRAVFLALLIVAALGLTSLPREKWWRESNFAPPLETVVIALKPWLPNDVAVRIKYR